MYLNVTANRGTKPKGCHVFSMEIRHFRYRDQHGKFLPNGGNTVILFTDSKGSTTLMSCRCSTKDRFNKKTGVKTVISEFIRTRYAKKFVKNNLPISNVEIDTIKNPYGSTSYLVSLDVLDV